VFVGHFAAGLIARRISPATSLATTTLASLLPDVLFCVFLVTGIEHIRIQPGITVVNPLDLYDIALSHSLLLDFVWALLLAALYFWRSRNRFGASVLFVLVLSHWLLDFVSHRPDMPLAPGVSLHLGLGLWNSVPATFIVEGALWLISVAVYARATTAKTRTGIFAFWIMIAVLTAIWIVSLRGTPPPDVPAVAVVNSVLFSIVMLWALWIDRLRHSARV
jgi:hypothetical protein